MINTQLQIGRHVLAEFWGCPINKTNEVQYVEKVLIDAVHNAGAKVIASRFHSFGEGLGITGFVMLAQSHVSVHSWPEYDYVAIDVFVCGDIDPYAIIKAMRDSFCPTKTDVIEQPRGIINHVK